LHKRIKKEESDETFSLLEVESRKRILFSKNSGKLEKKLDL